MELLAFTLMCTQHHSLQGRLFSPQTPHLSTCRWSRSQCWRTTWSRSTALPRPTPRSPSTGERPCWGGPPTPCLAQGWHLRSRRPAPCLVRSECPGPFPGTPVHPALARWTSPFPREHILPSSETDVTPSVCTASVPLISERKETREKKLKQAITVSQIQILVLCSPNRSPGRVGLPGPPALTIRHPDSSSPQPPCSCCLPHG